MRRRSSHATFTRLVTIQSLLFIINTKRIRATLLTPLLPGWSPSRASCSSSTPRGSGQLYSRHFYQVGGPPPILLTRLDISGGAGSQWCPPSVFFLKPKGLGTGGSPHQGVHSIGFNMGGISRRGGARGEGGAEDQW